MENKKYESLVVYEAGRLACVLGLYIKYDTLLSFGTQWLCDCPNYLSEKEASIQIRNFMLNKIRNLSYIKDIFVQKQSIVENAKSSLIKKQKELTNKNIAKEMGIDVEEYLRWKYDEEIIRLLYPNGDFKETADIPKGNLACILEKAFSYLATYEKMVIDLFYYENLTLQEMVLVLEDTEENIVKEHALAMSKLKEHLGKYIMLFAV